MDEKQTETYDGVAIEVTEVDPHTATVMGEVMLNIAQSLENGIVFIAITDMGESNLDFTITSHVGNGNVSGVQRVFSLPLMDWAKFNVALQNQIRQQVLTEMGIPTTATPEQAMRTLLDGMG